MYLITEESGVHVPADLRELIERKLGVQTDAAFGELCAVVDRLARNLSLAARCAAVRPLVSPYAQVTVLEKQS